MTDTGGVGTVAVISEKALKDFGLTSQIVCSDGTYIFGMYAHCIRTDETRLPICQITHITPGGGAADIREDIK